MQIFFFLKNMSLPTSWHCIPLTVERHDIQFAISYLQKLENLNFWGGREIADRASVVARTRGVRAFWLAAVCWPNRLRFHTGPGGIAVPGWVVYLSLIHI